MIKYYLFLFLLIFTYYGFSQSAPEHNFSIAGGLSTQTILGKSANTRPLIGWDSTYNDQGGGFSGAQPGITLQMTYGSGPETSLRVPVSVDYIFYDARQIFLYPFNEWLDAKVKFQVDVLSLNFGVQYVLLRIPRARTIVYGEIDSRNTIIHNSVYTQIIDYTNGQPSRTIIVSTKGSTFRSGAALKVGIEGDLIGPWQINTSFGLGIMNLIARDNSRGELLTPKLELVPSESYVYNYHFSLLIQYKL